MLERQNSETKVEGNAPLNDSDQGEDEEDFM